jgi:hypothetical protein
MKLDFDLEKKVSVVVLVIRASLQHRLFSSTGLFCQNKSQS